MHSVLSIHISVREKEVSETSKSKGEDAMDKRKLHCLAGILSALGLACSSVAGETVTVDNVTDLTNHLDRLNRLNTEAFNASLYDGERHDTIILKPGLYDVSECEMLCSTEAMQGNDYVDGFSHLAISWLTLKGETGDPRDVVIYGNRSNRIVYMWLGTLEGVTISNGYASVDKTINGFRIEKHGAGVAARTATSLVKDCIVVDCEALGSGGALYNCQAKDTVVERCKASANGGGVNCVNPFNGGMIRGCASSRGGGAAVDSYLFGAIVSNNVCVGSGGGIYYGGVSNCLVFANTAQTGGGLANVDAAYDCIISNNVAIRGGGIYDTRAFHVDLVHNLARSPLGNQEVCGGGAYGSGNGKCVVYDSVIAGNACALENSYSDRSGGGGECVDFIRCRIYDNFAYVGAALNFGSAEDCEFSNNVSCGPSGNCHSMVRATTRLAQCDISNQILCSPGHLYSCRIVDYCGEWTLAPGANVYTNGTFVNSRHMKDEELLINNNLNEAHSLRNCLVANNEVWCILSSAGKDQTTEIVNCTIASNVCACMYAGFLPETYPNALLILRNTIIAGNRDASGNDWNFYPRYGDAESSVVIENCMIGPGGWRWMPSAWPIPQGYSWSGLIESNAPRFIGRGNPSHPFSLRRTSPARGKGTVYDWMLDAYDIRGDIDDGRYHRIRDGKVDLGCYQCWLGLKGTVMVIR